MKKILGLLLAFCMLIAVCPMAYAAEYAYEINNVYFTDLAGRTLENPTTSCMVNVEVTKNNERIGNEIVAIATYSTDGAMINMTTVSGTMQKGEKELFSTLVWSPSGKNVGMVRTFIWNNISEMRPMSEVFVKEVNQLDEGVELPDISEPPMTGTYIPSTVTVEGKVVGTSVTNYLENGEYEIEIYPVAMKVDDIYTEEEYNARVTRTEVICNYYNLPCKQFGDESICEIVRTDIDLDGYLFCEGLFELRLVDGDYEVVAFEPKESKNIIYVQADDYVFQSDLEIYDRYSGNSCLKFGKTNYRMEERFNLYVNGALYRENIKPSTSDIDSTLDIIFGKAIGKVKMMKNDGAKRYTDIFVECFEIAKVTGVEYADGERTINIETREPMDVVYDEIIISDEYLADGSVSVTVLRDGEDADLSEIAEGDIIAYAIDYENEYNHRIWDPRSIKILVTSRVVTGKVREVDRDAKTVTINLEDVYADPWSVGRHSEIGYTYTLTLDPFGRIFAMNMEKFNSKSRFAVVRKAPIEFETEDGVEVEKVLVLYNGQESELYFEPGVFRVDGLAVGDAFFFETDFDGIVTMTYPIYKKSTNEIMTLEAWEEYLPVGKRGWSYNLWNEGKDIQLVAGYVVDVNYDTIALTTTTAVENGYIDTNVDIDDTGGHTKGVATFGIDPDCVAYEYDTDEDIIREIDRFSAFDGASVKASAFGRFEHPEDPSVLVESYVEDGETIELGDMNDYANFAVAMIVDGDIVAIYTVIPE